jgi:hypothetical protein
MQSNRSLPLLEWQFQISRPRILLNSRMPVSRSAPEVVTPFHVLGEVVSEVRETPSPPREIEMDAEATSLNIDQEGLEDVPGAD